LSVEDIANLVVVEHQKKEDFIRKKPKLFKMKFCFFIILFISKLTIAQTKIDSSKVDSSNYYNYYHSYNSLKDLNSDSLITAWLTADEVTPIILEEMRKLGFDWVNENSLFKLTSGQDIILSAYSEKSKVGFLYIESHSMFPTKEDRLHLTEKETTGSEYVIQEETSNGDPNFIHVEKLPNNIFILNQNCYWYQFTANPADNNYLITKELAFKILREDIDHYLSKMKH
jgi:hypothetical protein